MSGSPGRVIALRRDTEAEWAADNPTLAVGETGWTTDTRRVKLGDGVTAWNDLPYAVDGDIPAQTATPVSTDGSYDLPEPTGTGFEFVIDADGLQDIRMDGVSL
jgi:hypothetical protein